VQDLSKQTFEQKKEKKLVVVEGDIRNGVRATERRVKPSEKPAG
jgi:hypothetical protein